jgi:hypothetical protein
MGPGCEKGQSLAEFVLCLRRIFFLIFGLIQIAIFPVVTAFSHYAASCALRSYTVFYAQGKSLALDKAGRAMEQAFAWCYPMPDLDLEIKELRPQSGALASTSYQGQGPLIFQATLTAEVPLLVALRGRDSIEIVVQSSMLSEKTLESE